MSLSLAIEALTRKVQAQGFVAGLAGAVARRSAYLRDLGPGRNRPGDRLCA
jgi:hypothetical protein